MSYLEQHIKEFSSEFMVLLVGYVVSTSLMKQQFVVTNKVSKTEIPAFLDSWVTTHLLSKGCIHKIIKV